MEGIAPAVCGLELVVVSGLVNCIRRVSSSKRKTTRGMPLLSEYDGQVSLALPCRAR